MTEPKIKFGIMCNKEISFQRWQANAITALIAHEQIECCLLIQNGIVNKRNFRSRLRLLKYKSFLWQIYSYVAGKDSTATKSVLLDNKLSRISKMTSIVQKKGKFSEFFSDNDVEHIKSFNLDFILRFEFGIIKGGILDSTKYGIWSFHHGDEQKYRGGPPAFWEIHNGDNITGSILQRLNDKLDAGIILKKGLLKTQSNYVANRDQVYLESARWPLQVCLEIINNGQPFILPAASSTRAAIKVEPSNLQLVFFLIKTNIRKIRKIFEVLMYVDFWNIGVVHNNAGSFLTGSKKPSVAWFPLKSKKMFYADPCGLEDDNGLHIFFEAYPYKKSKGEIFYTNFSNDIYSEPKVILEESFHLSYPFLVEDNGCIYMVPESCEANSVMLYQAVEFPENWKMIKVLIDNYPGVDNTLFKYDDIWWMFSSDKNKGSSHNLNLFYADDLLSEWIAHPCNPIKTDIRSARSAGKPFIYDENIYRPSMNYSEKTEGSVSLNMVTVLTKKKYSEKVIKEILPYSESKFPDKIHHLFATKNYTLVDGCKETLVLRSLTIIRHQFAFILSKLFEYLGISRVRK
jgi:hypothetical protein